MHPIVVHSRLFGLSSGRAGLTYVFPSVTAIMCGVWTPESDVRLHARFFFFSIFELDLATCSRRGLENRIFGLMTCFKRHSSAHIYNNSASFHHSHGVSGRPQEPGQAWGGISVSLLSSIL